MSALRRSKTAKLEAEVGANVKASIGARESLPKVVTQAEDSGPPRERVRADSSTFRIPLAAIDPDPDQPRKEFDPESLRELAESLKQSGQLQACIVRPGREKGRYVLVMGERRYRAAKLAGMNDVLCRVELGKNRGELLADQLVENIAREELSPMDLARALATLRDTHKWSQLMIAHRVRLTQSAVAKSLALLDLPKPVQKMVEEEKLPASTAREVSKVGGVKEQIALAKKAIDESLTRDQVVAEVRGKNIPREYPEASPAGAPLVAGRLTKPSAGDAPFQSFDETASNRIKGGRYTLAQLNLEAVEVPEHHAIVGDLANVKKRASVRVITWIKGNAYVYTGGTYDNGRKVEAFFHPIMKRAGWTQPLRIYAKNPPGLEKMTGVEVMYRGELWVLGSGKDGLIVSLKAAPRTSAKMDQESTVHRTCMSLEEPSEVVVLGRHGRSDDKVTIEGNTKSLSVGGGYNRRVFLGDGVIVSVRQDGGPLSAGMLRDTLYLAFTAADRLVGKSAGKGVAP